MQRSGQSANLDLLRTFAVLLVLLSHCIYAAGNLSWSGIGQAGVLLFFVHTALVLMFSLERLQAKREFIVTFYLHRFFRIYPLALCCMALCLAFRIPVSPREEFQWWGWRWVALNVMFVQNLTIRVQSISGPLWSLCYEVQMYLVLPFVFLVAIRKRGLWLVSALWIGSVRFTDRLEGYLNVLYGANWADSFHGPVTRFVPCFLSGALAFILWRRPRAQFTPALLVPAIGLFVWLIVSQPIWHPEYVGCLAVGLLLPHLRELTSTTVRHTAHYVAKYSYGCYLCHIPLMWVFFRHFASISAGTRWALYLGAVVTVSIASYHILEAPAIEWGRRVATRVQMYRHDGSDNEPSLELHGG